MPLQRKNLQVGDAVLVEWIDAQGNEAWVEMSELAEDSAPVIKTLGYITGLTKDYISVSQSIDEENAMASHTMLIPAGMVTRVAKIRS